jgi:hypothetical protein
MMMLQDNSYNKLDPLMMVEDAFCQLVDRVEESLQLDL